VRGMVLRKLCHGVKRCYGGCVREGEFSGRGNAVVAEAVSEGALFFGGVAMDHEVFFDVACPPYAPFSWIGRLEGIGLEAKVECVYSRRSMTLIYLLCVLQPLQINAPIFLVLVSPSILQTI